MIRVTIWNEGRHEKLHEAIRAVYPEGIHGCLASALGEAGGMQVRTVTLDDPGQGLPAEVLDATDVLVWWGHMAHHEVEDSLARRVQERVLGGMGLIALHSAHHSKPFRLLMGTTCNLRWRHGDRERLWCCSPGHPIARGVSDPVELEVEEMYGEHFDIPEPDELVWLGWFAGGEAIRAGCTFTRGRGRIFYFQPGHEEYPVYRNPAIRRIIANAAAWAAPSDGTGRLSCTLHPEAPEDLRRRK